MSRAFFEDLANARVEVGKLLYNIGDTELSAEEKRELARCYVSLSNMKRKRQGKEPITVDSILKGMYN